jgi:hypothetical protein
LSAHVIVHGRNADATNGGLKLDERMSVVVTVARVSLAVLAEIGVVAHSALVTDTLNVRQVLLVLAQGTVTIDAGVAVAAVERLGQRFIDWHKTMAGVDVLRALDTVGAVVPVWAVQALVTDAIDELVTSVANGGVADIASGVAKEVCQSWEGSIRGSSGESMTGVVAVLVADVAVHAQVVVFAGKAGDELLLGEALDAAVACAGGLVIRDDRVLLVGVGARDFAGLLGLDLGRNALGGAVHDAAVLDEALDHPVASARAVDSGIHASGAEIVVAAVADAAVEVLVFHGVVAVVAIHDPRGAGARLRAECEIGIVWVAREVVEEAYSYC